MHVLRTLDTVEQEGLLALIGQPVEFYCGVYIYAGTLIGVNDTCVKISNPHIVYETGAHTDAKYKDAQPLNREFHYIQLGLLESFGVTKKLG